MSDPINQLTGDHSQVKRLFNQWSNLGGTEPGMESALAITSLLKIHATLEEELVYPALSKIDDGLAQEAENEHAQAKEIISSIEAMPTDSSERNTAEQRDAMIDAMDRLRTSVLHHVEIEENVMFPKLLAECTAEFLEAMGRNMYRRRQQLLGGEQQGATEALTGIAGRDASPKI